MYLTQNRESYLRVLKNDAAVDSLLGNLQAKFFCQNTGQTNSWAAFILGQRWVKMTSTTAGQQRKLTRTKPQNEGNHSSGVTRAEQMKMFVEAATFTTLKRGGEAHNFLRSRRLSITAGNLFYTGNLGASLPATDIQPAIKMPPANHSQ